MLWHGKNFRGFINKAKEMIFDNTGTDLTSTNAEDAIKEVNSKLARYIKTDTFSGQTAATGWLQLYSGNDRVVLAVTFNSINNRYAFMLNGDGLCGMIVMADHSTVANRETVSGTYYYVDK